MSSSRFSLIRSSRVFPVVIFGAAMAWFLAAQNVAARSARGLSNRFDVDAVRPLLSSLFLLFLLFVGFSLLAFIAQNLTSTRSLLGLPKRATWPKEWLLGAAIGWGAAVLSILPLAFTRSLSVGFWTEPRAFWLVFLNLAALAAGTLAEEVAFRGYPFQRLIGAIGPTGATLVLSGLYGLFHMLSGNGSVVSFLITTLAGILLALGWLRTHGLWLPWGLHFAWNASLGILFGLPVAGSVEGSTVIQSTASGRSAFTGGEFGPEASLWAIVALTAAIVVLIHTTRDYAWNYTHPMIVPRGYPMNVAAPAAHVEMEQRVQQPTLVQIQSTVPQGRSAGEESRL